jgi:hypothetical protein
MKAVDKYKPIKFFRDNVYKYKEYIQKRDMSFIDLFIEENQSYVWLREGINLYLQMPGDEMNRVQNFIWEQINILVDLCECYINNPR